MALKLQTDKELLAGFFRSDFRVLNIISYSKPPSGVELA